MISPIKFANGIISQVNNAKILDKANDVARYYKMGKRADKIMLQDTLMKDVLFPVKLQNRAKLDAFLQGFKSAFLKK